jgi:hypothetical protein
MYWHLRFAGARNRGGLVGRWLRAVPLPSHGAPVFQPVTLTGRILLERSSSAFAGMPECGRGAPALGKTRRRAMPALRRSCVHWVFSEFARSVREVGVTKAMSVTSDTPGACCPGSGHA